MIAIRHKNIELEWRGFPNLHKVGSFTPIKLRYNGTVGWWVSRKVFLSYNQVKEYLNIN